jgi:hypothetical protein
MHVKILFIHTGTILLRKGVILLLQNTRMRNILYLILHMFMVDSILIYAI